MLRGDVEERQGGLISLVGGGGERGVNAGREGRGDSTEECQNGGKKKKKKEEEGRETEV